MNRDELIAMYDFTGMTFAITGGAGVLGSTVVTALASCGANVMILDCNLARLPEIQASAGPHGSRIDGFPVDVMSRESLVAAGEAIKARFGALYGLVNAAGGNSPKATTAPNLSFFDIPEDGLRFVLDLNILGTILPCQVLGRQIAEAGEGVILNYSSMNAYRPLTKILAYSASKAAVTNFTAWLAVHLAQNYSPTLRVNAIAPGFFITEQSRFLLTDRETGAWSERGRRVIDHTPMGRMGVPEDTVPAVLFLLSPASAFVTGITLPVDGGFSAFSGV